MTLIVHLYVTQVKQSVGKNHAELNIYQQDYI